MAEESPGSRPIWSGTITFGLVAVPVDLYPAIQSSRITLKMLGPDGTPLRRRFVCSADDTTLDDDEIVRGYELKKDTYVVVEDEELQALEPRKSRDIDLKQFVPVEELDPLFFERPYFLAPSGQSTKAYRLLAKIMEEEKKAGVATFVMRDKEYLVAILSERGILRAETLRFSDEVRKPADLGLPKRSDADKKAVNQFTKAIQKTTSKAMDRDELRDEVAASLEKLVLQKRKKKKDVVVAGPEYTPEPVTVDLMAVLKNSLARSRRKAS